MSVAFTREEDLESRAADLPLTGRSRRTRTW